ncbi:hypothetical protein HOY80DRAFT_997652 [Tuber brumale]|nr:hypothetical protein HOY80DRAFT_997652 [Tuber brumale]
MADYFENHAEAAPQSDIPRAIHTVAEARNKLPASVVFHYWQKVDLVELLDYNLHSSYDNHLSHICSATQVPILSLLDTSCHSKQVMLIADDFLDYNKEAGDEHAHLENISLADIVDYLDSEKKSTSDLDSDEDILQVTPYEMISVSLANTYLAQITNLLECLLVDILQIMSQALPIPIAVQHFQKIQQDFHSYEESKQKQGTLNTLLQIGLTKGPRKETIAFLGVPSSLIPEPACPTPILVQATAPSTTSPDPALSPPSQLLCFSPIAQDRVQTPFEAFC